MLESSGTRVDRRWWKTSPFQGTRCKRPVFPKNKSWCPDAIERVIKKLLERGTCRGGLSWSLEMLVVGTVEQGAAGKTNLEVGERMNGGVCG